MTFPVELHMGKAAISLHIIFETLAFTIGFRYYVYLRKQKPDSISDANRLWILIGAIFGAWFFSRLVGAMEYPSQFLHSPHLLLYFFASKTIVGGLLGGLLGVEIIKYFIGEKQSSGDLFTYPLILAMIIGRLGCFTSGITEPTYGIETTAPWGMDLGDGHLRHPVALYEMVFLGALWVTLIWIERRFSLLNGDRFKLFMIAYLLFRFGIEFIKPGYRYFAGLGTIQIVCMLGVFYYLQSIIRFTKSLRYSEQQNVSV